MQQATAESGATLVIRGAKITDEHLGADNGTVAEGIEYVCPLWTWTDAQVFEYLAEHGVALPLQYRAGCNHSLDCMRCTAWGNTQAEAQRVRFTRTHYPEAFKELQERYDRVCGEIARQLDATIPYFEAITEDTHADSVPQRH